VRPWNKFQLNIFVDESDTVCRAATSCQTAWTMIDVRPDPGESGLYARPRTMSPRAGPGDRGGE